MLTKTVKTFEFDKFTIEVTTMDTKEDVRISLNERTPMKYELLKKINLELESIDLQETAEIIFIFQQGIGVR